MKKRLILILLAGSLGMASAMAMPDAPPEAGQHFARMQTALGLSDDQVSQIQAIEAAQWDKMEALHVLGHDQIVALLSAEQAAKFEQMAQQRPQGRMPNGQRPPADRGQGDMRPPQMQGGRDPAGGMMARMKTELGLSDEQAAQIEVIQQDQRTQMQALHSETQTLIRQVLTAEQATQVEQMGQRHRPFSPPAPQ